MVRHSTVTANQLTAGSQTSNASKSTTSKKRHSSPRLKHPIIPNVCQRGRPIRKLGLSAGMGWRVGGGGGGLIWGQSIDLPSLYLLPAHHAKINGKANSSPPQCGLVNTQLISQSLKLTSQLLTYWYGRHVLSTHTHTHTHTVRHIPIQTSAVLTSEIPSVMDCSSHNPGILNFSTTPVLKNDTQYLFWQKEKKSQAHRIVFFFLFSIINLHTLLVQKKVTEHYLVFALQPNYRDWTEVLNEPLDHFFIALLLLSL